jgi:putative ABC transport system substrate-binding protein
MDRRRFLTALGGGLLAAPLAAEAQPEQKPFRLGAVSAGAPRSSPHWVAFAQRLHELGYVEGKSISIKFRNAEGKPERSRT